MSSASIHAFSVQSNEFILDSVVKKALRCFVAVQNELSETSLCPVEIDNSSEVSPLDVNVAKTLQRGRHEIMRG